MGGDNSVDIGTEGSSKMDVWETGDESVNNFNWLKWLLQIQ